MFILPNNFIQLNLSSPYTLHRYILTYSSPFKDILDTWEEYTPEIPNENNTIYLITYDMNTINPILNPNKSEIARDLLYSWYYDIHVKPIIRHPVFMITEEDHLTLKKLGVGLTLMFINKTHRFMRQFHRPIIRVSSNQ